VRVFKSRVDRWVALSLIAPVLAGLGTVGGGLVTSTPGMSAAGGLILVLFGLILFGLVLPMRYVIEPQALAIHFGLARIDIPFERLVSARLSSSPLSSPALSLLRVEIEYRGRRGGLKTVRISPADRLAFLRALAEASPRHRLANDSVALR
jgi:hypothetical protein